MSTVPAPLPRPPSPPPPSVAQVVSPPLKDPLGAALDALARTQSETGSWKGDYGGPLFLLPMYVGTAHATGLPLPQATRDEMVRYLRNHQNRDGGFGLDVESHSHVFTSVLNYVALRLLGVPKEDPLVARARAWFLRQGGATASASWGKFFLCLMGLYEYEGIHPLPPELWLLPRALPFHPSRLWCHARMVYLPMSVLYARRAKLPLSPLTAQLREELFDRPYAEVDWEGTRDDVALMDAYTPRSPLMKVAHTLLAGLERRASPRLRRHAIRKLLGHIRYEDDATQGLCIGPVNQLLNAWVWHVEAPGGPELARHHRAMPEYLWQARDGVKMQGYNSSELWDTAFAAQALMATGRLEQAKASLTAAYRFIEQNQIRQDPPELDGHYRHTGKGGWPFSTVEHGWPISDCTAEGLKASLLLQPLGLPGEQVTPERQRAAAELLLTWQNADGGWATYELTRGPKWLEQLNPSDCFADIMIDHSHVECTSASVQALAAFCGRYPHWATRKMRSAVERGVAHLLERQRPDGSWEGAWGVCFTYGTWFGVWGLASAQGLVPARSRAAREAMEKACRFLEAQQLPDGGWGETPSSCRQRRYVHAERGQAVMTSWALLTLVKAGRAQSSAVKRGREFLLSLQREDGTWPEEHLAGVFNRTCAIHYDAYLRVFPLWALALCDKRS